MITAKQKIFTYDLADLIHIEDPGPTARIREVSGAYAVEEDEAVTFVVTLHSGEKYRVSVKRV